MGSQIAAAVREGENLLIMTLAAMMMEKGGLKVLLRLRQGR
jgi:hypothetical protein